MRFLTKKLMLGLVIGGVFSGALWASPHDGESFKLRQPDGSLVPVLVWGDEFYQHVESPDGFTLIKDDKTGYISYAKVNANGELESTGEAYVENNPAIFNVLKIAGDDVGREKHIRISDDKKEKIISLNRDALNGAKPEFSTSVAVNSFGVNTTSSASLTNKPSWATEIIGDVQGLTLLIDFPDQESSVERTEIFNMINQIGYRNFGNKASIREYFQTVSSGRLDYSNTVTAYYTASNPSSYYKNDDSVYGSLARELIIEALDYLDAEGFDFTSLTTNQSGQIIGLNALYAGEAETAWATGLWPHKGWIGNEGASYDGLTLANYQITNIGTSLTIGTFVHETGHMLMNWPDLYDKDGGSRGAGRYGVMSYKNTTNPQPPNPFFRELAGWETSIDITREAAQAYDVISDTYGSYRYCNEGATAYLECFYIEAKNGTGHNASVPDKGLLIWHVDSRGNNSWEDQTEAKHFVVSVEQADGLFSLEDASNYGGANDLFHSGNNDTFGNATLPNSRWWSGESSGLEIFNISNVATQMSFTTGEVVAPEIPEACLGVDNWNYDSLYSQAAEKVIHDGILYSNKWYNTGSTPGNPSGPWTAIGVCDGSTVQCSNIATYDDSLNYPTTATYVTYQDKVWWNLHYANTKNEPGVDAVWVFEGNCAE